MRESITLFKPKKIQIEEIIKEDEPSFSYNIDKFYYIIGLITELKSFRRYDAEDSNPFTPLNSQILKKLVWNYQNYLTYLVEQGVLEVDSQYIPHEKSRGYRFTNEYLSPTRRVSLTDKKLIHKILEYDEERKAKLKSESIYACKQIEWFQHLSIDIEKAVGEIKELAKIQTTDQGIIDLALINKLNLYHVSVHKIHDKRFQFTLDTTSKRFHSNLTNLKKEFRQYLRCDGEELIGIDISNSQPYLTLLLLNKDFYKNEKLGKFLILKDFNGINTKEESINTINNILTPLCTGFDTNNENFEKLKSQYEEIEKYKNSVKNDCFYDDFSKEYSKKMNNDISLERKQIKKIIYSVLFSRNKYNSKETTEYKEIFKSIYPTVFEVLSLIKDSEHNTLAILLQSIESKIVLEYAYVRIMYELPDAPLFSIHDSLLTTKKYVSRVRDVLEEELNNATGYKPHLKTE